MSEGTMSGSKILFYTHALLGGGAERVWARLASGLAARGHEVQFVVDFEDDANRSLVSQAVRLRVLPSGHFASTRALAAILRRERPAVSLSAISAANLKHAVAAGLAGRLDRAILSYHGFAESEPQRLSQIAYRLTPILSRRAAATVAVSRALRADMISRFAAASERVLALANPAAPEPFPAPVAAGDLAARPPLVLALGRLVPDKAFEALLAAFANLRDPEARLVILGEGPGRAALEAEVVRLGLSGRVDMPGFVDDTARWFQQARCFALSSRRESFGLVCVEALSFGLPCVVTRSGGPEEIVDDPALGVVIEPGDVAGLTRALDAALAAPGDPAPRQARAAAYSLAAALDRYEELIARVVSHARSPA
jgi:glycosyltransferase involved in cell wall biosynthesis